MTNQKNDGGKEEEGRWKIKKGWPLQYSPTAIAPPESGRRIRDETFGELSLSLSLSFLFDGYSFTTARQR